MLTNILYRSKSSSFAYSVTTLIYSVAKFILFCVAFVVFISSSSAQTSYAEYCKSTHTLIFRNDNDFDVNNKNHFVVPNFEDDNVKFPWNKLRNRVKNIVFDNSFTTVYTGNTSFLYSNFKHVSSVVVESAEENLVYNNDLDYQDEIECDTLVGSLVCDRVEFEINNELSTASFINNDCDNVVETNKVLNHSAKNNITTSNLDCHIEANHVNNTFVYIPSTVSNSLTIDALDIVSNTDFNGNEFTSSLLSNIYNAAFVADNSNIISDFNIFNSFEYSNKCLGNTFNNKMSASCLNFYITLIKLDFNSYFFNNRFSCYPNHNKCVNYTFINNVNDTQNNDVLDTQLINVNDTQSNGVDCTQIYSVFNTQLINVVNTLNNNVYNTQIDCEKNLQFNIVGNTHLNYSDIQFKCVDNTQTYVVENTQLQYVNNTKSYNENLRGLMSVFDNLDCENFAFPNFYIDSQFDNCFGGKQFIYDLEIKKLKYLYSTVRSNDANLMFSDNSQFNIEGLSGDISDLCCLYRNHNISLSFKYSKLIYIGARKIKTSQQYQFDNYFNKNGLSTYYFIHNLDGDDLSEDVNIGEESPPMNLCYLELFKPDG